jgi:transposase
MGVNALKPHKKTTVITLLSNQISQHEIHRKTGVDRKTIRRLARDLAGGDSNSPMATGPDIISGQNPPPRPPDGIASKPGVEAAKTPSHARSACELHRTWIEEQIGLGRNAQAIYQELVDRFGFSHRYNSVKRFCRGLKKREPEQFDRLEFLPGEEAQVDYGEGALTLHPETGKYRKPRLFVMTLKYSRKSFRKVVWKSSKETWARLHEEAFRYFGGCPQYIVLDNLKEGVIKPDLYEPELNSLYREMLAHYGVAADPARVCDPNRKGTVESAIQHTQNTALKGRRFASIEEQNEYLLQWEERWASQRIHGRTKRQVEAMYIEEKPHLKPLPAASFRIFREEIRTVQDDGTVQVDGSWYAARPAVIGSQILVRIFELEVAILEPRTLTVVRRHPRAVRKGEVRLPDDERIYNPSRQTHAILKEAQNIGPKTHELCLKLFENEGRSGHKRLRGIVALARKHPAYRIERGCDQALAFKISSYKSIVQVVEDLGRQEAEEAKKRAKDAPVPTPLLTQSHELIRDPQEYFEFWKTHAAGGETIH